MARETINGIGIDYELLGDPGAPVVAITPGGRFAKDSPGVPQLAQALVAGGKRVLLWDRPNCGSSDLCFEGDTESVMQSEAFIGLIRALGIETLTLAGGSAGSRISLIAASRAPELVSHLVIWWISGGPIGLMQLANVYCQPPATLASYGGMEAVANSDCFADQFARNPANRDIVLKQDPKTFIETMQRWAKAYCPSDTSPVPGMGPEHFAKLTMPVLIYRSGPNDLSHTRRTSEWVHEMIPHSQFIDPPWGEEEWNQRCFTDLRKESGLFGGWPALAPKILEFTAA